MAYNKTKWEDLPSVETPISAENLNKIEQGIYDAHEQLDKLPQWSKEEEKPRYTADEVGAYSKEETKAFLDGKANAIINSATGETVVTTDSANATPSIKLFGKSEQVTYQGNQLLNLPNVDSLTLGNKITWSCKDGVVTAKGNTTSITNTGGYIYQHMPIVAGNYFVSGDGKYAKVFCKITKQDGSTAYYYNRAFTLDGTETDVFVYVAIQNDGLNVDINETIYPMLNKGTTALPFEPYVGGEASPNLNYPQDVVPHGSSGSIEQKILNSNIASATVTDKTARYMTVLTLGCDLKPSTKYSLSFKGTPNNVYYANENVFEYVQLKVDANGYAKGILTTLSKIDASDTKQHNGTEWVVLKNNQENQAHNITEVMFNLGEQPLPYEPYSEQVLVHQTPNGLHGIGDVTDMVDSGKGQRINVFAQKVFNGSENWLLGSGQGTHKRFYLSNAFDDIDTSVLGDDNVPNALCTAFRPATPNETYMGGVNTFSINARKVLYVCCSCTTVEEFKQKLSENPMTVYYQLAEPIVTDLTDEELAQYNAIHMNYPNTTIVNSDSAYTVVEYVADTKCYIDKKFKELEVALANTNAQLL